MTNARVSLCLIGLSYLLASGAALAQSGGSFQVSDSRVELGRPLLGDVIEASSIRSPGPNCYITASYIDCEYQDDQGVRVLVYGAEVTRKCVDGDYIGRGGALPFGVNARDDILSAERKINNASTLPFVRAGGSLRSDGTFINRNGVVFAIHFKFADAGDLAEVCATDVNGGA